MDELHDWEILHSSSDSESINPSDEIDSAGLVQVNYFSLDAQNRRHVEDNFIDDNSIESDNPSWIDPGSQESPTRYLNKDSGEFWSDSSSERSEDRIFNEFEGINEMGFLGKGKMEVGFEGIGEKDEKKGEKMEDLGNFYSDSSGIEVGGVKFEENSEVGANRNANLRDEDGDNRRGESEKKFVMWWKMPVELLKYCVFRMSPVWSVSVAAAVMGLVILGRRLYKMKTKARGLEVKITVDDKKVSQVMSRAARLNEAFSVVKRVPIIRPSLPTVGVTTWPVMNLR